VAQAIALEIKGSLKADEGGRLTQLKRVTPEAYEAFLRANHFLHQNIPGIQRSIEWFRRAFELDPAYADAHAALAHALVFSGIYDFVHLHMPTWRRRRWRKKPYRSIPRTQAPN
jgi:hypothetical protein